MRAADLIAIWERGHTRARTGRAQMLAEAAGRPQSSGLTVGQRDALLMDLRGALFGTSVTAIAHCPGCGETLEFGFDLRDVRTPPPGDPSASVEVAHDGYLVQARPPTVADLAAVEHVAAAREALLARCVLDARRDGAPVSATELPGDVIARLGERLAEADPQADVRLALRCPECARSWSTAFDVVTFLWHELDTWARRLIGEVHALAGAYGWAEADILAMSAWRRSLYLRMVRP